MPEKMGPIATFEDSFVGYTPRIAIIKHTNTSIRPDFAIVNFPKSFPPCHLLNRATDQRREVNEFLEASFKQGVICRTLFQYSVSQNYLGYRLLQGKLIVREFYSRS